MATSLPFSAAAKGLALPGSLPFSASFDILKDCLKYRCFEGRLPAGLSIYSPAKLLAANFRHPHGILATQDRVMNSVLSH